MPKRMARVSLTSDLITNHSVGGSIGFDEDDGRRPLQSARAVFEIAAQILQRVAILPEVAAIRHE